MNPRYGPDEKGLICGYVFAPGQPGQPIGPDQALAWLAGSDQASRGEFVWLHFSLADAAAEPWLRENLDLRDEFFEALHQGSRSTRLEDVQDQLLAVINDVAYEFSFDPSQIATLWLNVDRRLLVSARLHPLRSIDRLRQAVRQGEQFASPVALLTHLLNDQADVLARIVRDAAVKVDDIEDGLLHDRVRHTRRELGQLRRVLVRLQRLLAPEPAALFRLLRQPPRWIAQDDLEELRQSTEEFSLVIRDAAALQERIKLLQEEMAALVDERTSQTLFTLTMVTVLALPINITTGFFGMNVGGMPLSDSPHGFAITVTVVTVCTLIAAWIAFRRRD
ncbi:MAG TPA: transporter [Ideonella sp.]|uniref:transporter n=1 Tax=Ideonella sp. TaxID=1929293 RepID=UPI002CBAD701|nr:transporter [Ideonella sp.]HSI51047.1 transporter [Ideonella sp.]